jgi:agmatinase
MTDQVVNTKDIRKADAVFLSAPYEGSVSFGVGTAQAPEKILHCLNNNLELFDINFLCEPARKIKTGAVKISGLERLSPLEAVKKVSEEYNKLSGKFVIMLGGEHTVSLGALDAIAKKGNSSDVTIFQIDAHQDLRDDTSDYSESPSRYAHSTVMRRAFELGFPLVQVGVRTFSKYEYDFWQANKEKIKVFSWTSEIPKIKEIVKAIKTKKVYLSIDVDGFDPAHMPGTGTPVPGGIDWRYGVELIEKITQEKELVGADIVEASPIEGSVLTEYAAAELAYRVLTNKFQKAFR